MIKYILPNKPEQLTNELQNTLTKKFKETKKSVWNIPWLKEAVADKSFRKCCFSDIRLGEESKYMEIEHFAPKNIYPDLVMEWSNLLPSCKTCNVSKGEHDSVKDRIINPFNDDPKDYLYIKAYRYYGKDNEGIGRRTIDILDLNNRNHFVRKRCEIGTEILEKLENIFEHRDLFSSTSIKRRNHLRRLKQLMHSGCREEEYSSLISTVILDDNSFKSLESFLRDNNLWDEELETLKTELIFCALPRP